MPAPCSLACAKYWMEDGADGWHRKTWFCQLGSAQCAAARFRCTCCSLRTTRCFVRLPPGLEKKGNIFDSLNLLKKLPSSFSPPNARWTVPTPHWFTDWRDVWSTLERMYFFFDGSKCPEMRYWLVADDTVSISEAWRPVHLAPAPRRLNVTRRNVFRSISGCA